MPVFNKNLPTEVKANDDFRFCFLSRKPCYFKNCGKQGRSVIISEQGKVLLPFEKQFWGSMFGIVEDHFGIRWQIATEL